MFRIEELIDILLSKLIYEEAMQIQWLPHNNAHTRNILKVLLVLKPHDKCNSTNNLHAELHRNTKKVIKISLELCYFNKCKHIKNCKKITRDKLTKLC